MAQLTQRMVDAICMVHGNTVDEAVRRMMALGIPLQAIVHVYTPGDADEYIMFERRGYHVVHVIEGEEVKIHAIPGHWSASNRPSQLKWIDDPKDSILTSEEREKGGGILGVH